MASIGQARKSLYQVVSLEYKMFESCDPNEKKKIEKLVHRLKPLAEEILKDYSGEIIVMESGYVIVNSFDNLGLVQKIREVTKKFTAELEIQNM